VKFIPPACEPDCLLTFAHVNHAFRSLTTEQWAELVGSDPIEELDRLPARVHPSGSGPINTCANKTPVEKRSCATPQYLPSAKFTWANCRSHSSKYATRRVEVTLTADIARKSGLLTDSARSSFCSLGLRISVWTGIQELAR